MPEFLSVADVLAIHARAMLATGEPPAPLRDAGRLERAVRRPRLAAYYERADVIRQAALLAAGLVQAHAFLDGNKRCAYVAADTHLRLHGLCYGGDPLALAELLLDWTSPAASPLPRR
ncbi:MAG: type II toxin-antitoxin system death-on-curing family toxin [Firmicutes bacterium]|nr:type II toxin-antitoxin system death-on-curing family toxin [Bacillota bacterium]